MLAATLAHAAPAGAQVSAYANEAPREVASLSDEDVAALLEGAGMGFARAAELNGVPGPRHALDLAEQLHIDAGQRARLETVFAHMNARARELGAEIVTRERALDSLFASGQASAQEVERQTLDIAVLYARLRATHLVAHLATSEILSRHQIERYAKLRGYAAGGHDAAGGTHGAHD